MDSKNYNFEVIDYNLIPFVTTINDFIQYPAIVVEQILLNIIFFIKNIYINIIEIQVH